VNLLAGLPGAATVLSGWKNALFFYVFDLKGEAVVDVE